MPAEPSTPMEAATVIRRVLEAVEAGHLDADTPQARRLIRRLEGAVGALEAPLALEAPD